VYLSIYRYRVQELTDDQARDGHSQDRQLGRTQTRAGHDEHTQKGARRAQKAARRRLKGKG
jgi:hypothetical protein